MKKQHILILGFSRVGEGGSNKDGTRMHGWLSYSLRIQRTARQQIKTVIYVCFLIFLCIIQWNGWMGRRKQSIKQGSGGKKTDIGGVIGSEKAEKKTKSEEAIFLYLV